MLSPTQNDSKEVQEDFDRIAHLDEPKWNHNSHYHAYLLRHIPDRIFSALDIGCGTGEFSRLLAGRSQHVLGLDFSPVMIQVARSRSADYPNLEFQLADATRYDLAPESFDCISSIAVFHHLPYEEMFIRIKTALKKGGVLLVLDLYKAHGLFDLMFDLPGIPVSLALRFFKNGQLRPSPAIRAAWAEHSKHEHYLTLAKVRRLAQKHLPGAMLRRHLLWRYSLIWYKK